MYVFSNTMNVLFQLRRDKQLDNGVANTNNVRPPFLLQDAVLEMAILALNGIVCRALAHNRRSVTSRPSLK